MTPEEFNQQCIDRLAAANLSSCVAVIGSGPSSPFIARIETLEDSLCARCGVTKAADQEFWVFCEHAHASNKDEYFNVLRETYGNTPRWTAHAYRHLTSMPFRAFATFNYDDQLPYEFRYQHRRNSNTEHFSVYPPRPGQRYFVPQEFLSSTPRLIALHGYSDPDNPGWERQVILKSSDYNRHYIDPPAPLFGWWCEILLAMPCIFIGTSLREPGLYRVMEHLRTQDYSRIVNRGHIHLLDKKPDPVSGDYDVPGKSFGVIEQVYYDPLDQHYLGLLKVLEPFSNLAADRPSPRAPAPKPITATDTFDF